MNENNEVPESNSTTVRSLSSSAFGWKSPRPQVERVVRSLYIIAIHFLESSNVSVLYNVTNVPVFT